MRTQIAILAAACLLTATAATAQQPPAANRGAALKPAAADGTLGMALLSATVNSDGSLVRGAGATGATHLNGGQYLVDFNRDVSVCTYAATIGEPVNGTASGMIDVQPSNGESLELFIDTFNTTGALADLPFHVIVFCAK